MVHNKRIDMFLKLDACEVFVRDLEIGHISQQFLCSQCSPASLCGGYVFGDIYETWVVVAITGGGGWG